MNICELDGMVAYAVMDEETETLVHGQKGRFLWKVRGNAERKANRRPYTKYKVIKVRIAVVDEGSDDV